MLGPAGKHVRAAVGSAASTAVGLTREALYATGAASVWAAGLLDPVARLAVTAGVAPVGEPTKTPVLFVHGLAANRSAHLRMERAAGRLGFASAAVNYSSVNASVEACGQLVADAAHRFAAAHDTDTILVVAHSLGGLACRWAAVHGGLGELVDTFVTIGSPHRGTPLAQAPAGRVPGVGAVIAQLRPGSAFLTGLDEATGPMRARWVVLRSGLDVVVPARYATLTHPSLAVRHIDVPNTGHIAMTWSPAVVALVMGELQAADQRLNGRGRVSRAPAARGNGPVRWSEDDAGHRQQR